MFKGMKTFVPSRICLACDGCCRFDRAESLWRPRIAPEEQKKAAGKFAVEKIFPQGVVDAGGQMAALPSRGQVICYFFQLQHNACGIYHARPFDCQLYPFLLLRKKGGAVAVGVHLNCPYVQRCRTTRSFQDYVVYLRGFFGLPEVARFLERNPCLAGAYPGSEEEIEELFMLPCA